MSIYTIGHEGDYDGALVRAQGEGASPVIKRGPNTHSDGTQYYGGYAFETVADALAYLDKIGKRDAWAVYEIDAACPRDVWHGHPSDDFMRLNRDAILTRKVEGHAMAVGAAQGISANE